MCSKLHANPSMLSQGGRSAAGPVGPAAAAAGAGTVAANGLAFVVVADSDGDDGGDAGVCGVKGGRCACAGTRPIRSQDAPASLACVSGPMTLTAYAQTASSPMPAPMRDVSAEETALVWTQKAAVV